MTSKKNEKKTSSMLVPGAVVDYEQSGSPQLALAIEERSKKWRLINESGKEVQLPAERIFVYPMGVRSLPEDADQRTALLRTVLQSAEEIRSKIDLFELWEILADEARSFELTELSEVIFTEVSLESHVALRRTLLDDTTYFKRKRNDFEPRSSEAVEQLKIKAQVETRKAEERDSLVDALCDCINGRPARLPKSISTIEQLAAHGMHASGAKKSLEVLRSVAERTSFKLGGRPEDQAYEMLVAAGHFSEHENISVYKHGRSRRFTDELLKLADELKQQIELSLRTDDPSREDFTELHTVSIDSEETCDIDDALSLEETSTGFRVGIHISDVAAAIPPDSALHDEALLRASSIYCPDFQIPMFPPALSADGLSLLEGTRRKAVSFIVDFDRNHNICGRTVLRSWVKIDRKLAYDRVDELLCEEQSGTSFDQRTDQILPILWSIAMKLDEKRSDDGAIAFHRREMTPVIAKDGSINLHESMDDSPSRRLVGELMILANETAALWARDNGIPLIFRSQDPPDVDIAAESESVPEGPAREYFIRSLLKRSIASTDALPHAGLGLEAYTHITSPIRRVIDLI
ncbi:MAG: RNB domain-containing ribonuclease, partial [Bdellovibrionales bacterium]|nr:RNB domain-containing ribonuclease [Bdellovibrionales bacterium]